MKYNKKIIFMVVGLVLVLITAVTTVFAAPDDNKEEVTNESGVFTCQGGNTEIDSLQELELFQSSFGIEIVDKNQQINISVDANKLNGVEFGVYLSYASESSVLSRTLVSTLNSSNPIFLYDYPSESGDYVIELAMINPGTTGCLPDKTNWTTTLSVEGSTSSENQYYNDNACRIIRGEAVTPSESYAFLTSYNSLTADNKVQLRTSGNLNEVTLCTEKYINTFGISRDALLANIANIVNNLELTQRLPSSNNADTVAKEEARLKGLGYIEVTDPSKENGIVLSCKEFYGLTGQDGLSPNADPKEFNNQGDDGEGNNGSWDTDYYTSVNQGKFYHIEEGEPSEPNGYCKKNCIESVTVSYGPPVATKGGICFEYKVKVVAEMVCEAVIDYSRKPKYEPACQPRPVCNSSSKLGDQGGPAEDFDACILEKDGGAYTQEGIDTCYNEVYGYDDELASDMALVSDFNITGSPIVASHLIIRGGTPINSTTATNIMNDVNAINSAGNGGKYVRDANGNITWVCNSGTNCQGNTYLKLGSYYFSSTSKAMQTIYNLNGLNYGNYSASLSGSYVVKAGGFKAGTSCDDACYWTGCSSTDTLNNSDAIEDYNKRLAEWNKEIQSCLAEATCNKITSEYTMQINIEDGEQKGNADIEFGKPSSDTSDNRFSTDVNINPENEGDENMIIDNGACYGNGDTTNKYMTEWTYPHTYINNKNGDVLYEKPEDTTGWREEENKFCLPLDQPDVNTLWFDWYINNMVRNPQTGYLEPKDLDLGSKDLTEVEKTEIINDREYNIFANTKNFGEYSWNIDIQCFFASRATNPECSGDNCDNVSGSTLDNGDGELDTTNETVNNYKYRAVTLENINTEDAEVVGFNWSEDANNFNIPEYEIVPGKLKDTIADRGSSIYEGDEYLDYHFVLTTKDLEQIRKYNASRSSYLDYGDNFYTDPVSGITFYISDFLRGKGDNSISSEARRLVPNTENACNNLASKTECESYIFGGLK